jgi:hypothetical protein
MTPLELSVSDATIWSITLELSIMILDESFTIIYYVYSTGLTYDDYQSLIDDRNMFTVQTTSFI